MKISCAGTISRPFICGVNDFLIRSTSLCGTGPCGMNAPLRGIGCVGDGVLLRILRHRLLVDPVERLAGLTVEHVEPAGLSGLRDALAPVGRVEEDGGARGVVVPDVVVHLLEPPPELARLRFDRDDRRRPLVVALPDASVPVRPRVSGREVEEAEVGVVGRRLPDRAAAVQVRVAGPATSLRRARPEPGRCSSARSTRRSPDRAPRGTRAFRGRLRRRRCTRGRLRRPELR